ncbi:hypothetical protein ACNSN2_18825 [Pseudoalteromonas sp. US3C1013]|uniref:hypothetical protein n=1 Tax=unclassified Pseudoalteromonas TaxID=194690 RepID=UPI003AB41B21
MTRNQKYEQKQKGKGLKKVTLWIPDNSEIEIKQMVDFLIDNPDHIPFMARSITTGRMKKAV